MTVSILDPHTALLVVDLQAGTIGSNPMAHPKQDVVANAATLAAAFRRHGLPVVLLTNVGSPSGRTTYSDGGSDWPTDRTELLPELGADSSDIRITKRSWGAFTSTDLDRQLRELAVTQVVICGVATSFGVESTAREAYDLDYNVAVAVDAVTDPMADGHERSVMRVFPLLGQTGTTAEIVDLLG